MTEAETLHALEHIPTQVVARASRSLPKYVDRDDLRSAAREALLATVRRHSKKPLEDVTKLAWRRCTGAVRDELRAAVQIRGARRRDVRAILISMQSLPSEAMSYLPEDPPMILSAVRKALDALPPRWRRVVVGHINDERNIDMAAELGVSHARIAQLYADAILRLQSDLRR